ncbi:MAG: hypothetical protein U9Q40_02090 [Campylobacterota bacterium]|nr:hypothetical protein [Campylobacterota bacterium]
MQGSHMFINILVLVVATMYGFFSGHIIPVVLGILFLAIYLYDDALYFTSLVLAILTIVSVIFFFFYDNLFLDSTLEFGTGILYMIVILFKAKNIFDAE